MDESRIYADFNNLDDVNRLKLTCNGTFADLKRLGIQLQEGMALTFYMDDGDDDDQRDDILVDGIVHFHQDEQYWTAEVNWNSLRHVSDEKRARANAAKLPA